MRLILCPLDLLYNSLGSCDLIGKLFLRAKYGNEGYNAGRLVWFALVAFIAWFVLGVKSCNDVRAMMTDETVKATIVSIDRSGGVTVSYRDAELGRDVVDMVGRPDDLSALGAGTLDIVYEPGNPESASIARGGRWIAPVVFLGGSFIFVAGLIGIGNLIGRKSTNKRSSRTKSR